MANYKENPRNSVITIRVTEQEKRELQKIADVRSQGKMSQLVWEVLADFLNSQK